MTENNINTHVVAVTGIVKKGNKYLLARRSFEDDWAAGEWSIPGGKIEMDLGQGIIEKALKREIMEEVGLKIKDHVEFVYNDGFIRVSGHHVVMMTFLCFWKSGEAKALEDQAEVRWLTIDEIKNMKDELPDYTWARIEALIEHEKINSSF